METYGINLDELASNFVDGQCKNVIKFYTREKVSKLMRCKGVCPYEYMDSWEKYEETRLPPKNTFYSKMRQ